MADVTGVIADLTAEGDELDALVAAQPDTGWMLPTPAQGWTVAHQISHLTWTDNAALAAIELGPEFAAKLLTEAGAAGLTDPLQLVDAAAASGAAQPVTELLKRWRTSRAALAAALRSVPAGTKIAWFGPPMSAASMATARLMETWAHGKDVADALGIVRPPTARLRHIAHLGVRTRDYAFVLNSLPVPRAEFRVELRGPEGEEWTWGPAGATQRVTGTAADFCLLVTRRANRADLDVKAIGGEADQWLNIAQAFAGPPGSGRPAASPGGEAASPQNNVNAEGTQHG